jgi:uncharacterized protein YecE (DUF72 family)
MSTASTAADIRVGTAGWSIPRASAFRIDAPGTHLQRYSRQLRCAEINSRKLRDTREPLAAFLAQTDVLAEKRGPILVQLPPSLGFDEPVAAGFLALLRGLYQGDVACEPRHTSWFSPLAVLLLNRYRIARVAADPAVVPDAAHPGGWPRLAYFRLHGAPRRYWSRYDEDFIVTLAATVRSLPAAEEIWCVFDNTASGAAIENAWEVRERLSLDPRRIQGGAAPGT